MTAFTMDLPSLARAPSSLPNIQDNRSDISLTSRATASTSARYYARKSRDSYGYPKVVQASCGFVCANFGSTAEINDNGGSLTARGLMAGKNNPEEGKDRATSGVRKPSSKHIDFKYTPSMLLPKSRNDSSRNQAYRSPLQEPAIDFMSYITSLRKGSVVPNDPDRLPIIMGPESSTIDRYPDAVPQRPNSVMSLSSNLSAESDSGSDEVFDQTDNNNNNPNLDENTDYLDNFAENDIARYRWALLRSKLKRKERRKSRSTADGSSILSEEHNHDEECPICAKAARQMGGQDVLMNWMLNKFGPLSGRESEM